VFAVAEDGQVVSVSATVGERSTSVLMGPRRLDVRLPLPDLPRGPATVSITATDDTGRTGRTSLSLVGDAEVPIVGLELTNSSEGTVSVLARYRDDTSVKSLSYAFGDALGVPLDGCPQGPEGECRFNVKPPSGLPLLVVRALDAADQTGSACVILAGDGLFTPASHCP
jgi:hypothetical protein